MLIDASRRNRTPEAESSRQIKRHAITIDGVAERFWAKIEGWAVLSIQFTFSKISIADIASSNFFSFLRLN